MNIQEKIKSLKEKITRYAEAYYLGEPIASDEEFDSLVKELELTDPGNSLCKRVSFGISVYGEKEELPINIRKSLKKYHDLDIYLPSLVKSYLHAPKVDGFSIIIKYNKGVLEKAWTREGLIITEKCKYIKYIPLVISEFESEIYLRGELYISWEDFENLKEDYVNPRNAMGLITRKSFENLEYVSFYLHPFQKEVKNNKEILNKYFKDPFILKNPIIEIDEHYRSNINIPIDIDLLKSFKEIYSKVCQIDGLVSIEETDYYKEFPEEYAFAFKFETEEVETEIEEIEWNLSNRGKLIPVVKYKPVQLYGTTCKQCSGYNYQYIKEHKLGKGSRIKLTKANEIIPYITEVITECESFIDPMDLNNAEYFISKHPFYNCSLFGNRKEYIPMKIDGVNMVVDDPNYFREQRLINFVKSCFDFDGFKRSEQILELYEIDTFDKLINFIENLGFNDFPDRLQEISIISLQEEVYKKWNSLSLDKELFLSYFGIDGLGSSSSKKLSKDLDKLENEYVAHGELTDIMISIIESSGVNKNVINIFKDKDILDDILNMYEWLSCNDYFIKEKEPSKFHTTVVITGSLSCTKSEMTKKLQQYGVKVEASINKLTNYLICEDKEGNSSKLQFAKKNGIPLLNEKEVLELFCK